MSESNDAMDASLVLTLEEITNLAQEGGKPAETLLNLVALIAKRFRTDVCSAYLLEPDRSNLVLAATLGLHPRSIGTLRMPINEGLAGLVWPSLCSPSPSTTSRLIRVTNISRTREKKNITPFLACRLSTGAFCREF